MKSVKQRLVLITVALGAMACSSSTIVNGSNATDGGPSQRMAGTYEGTANGFSIQVVDGMARSKVIADVRPKSPEAAFFNLFRIRLSDQAGVCADRAAEVARKNERAVQIELTKYGSTAETAALVPGSYELSPERSENQVLLYTMDEACSTVVSPLVDMAGTSTRRVIITSVTATNVKGSFEIRKGDASLLSGTFDVDVCDAPSPQNETCQ